MIILVFVESFFWVYMMMLFVRIIGSWVPEIQGYRFMQFVSYYTDPYLNFFRRYIPPIGMIDISPIIAFLALGVIESVVIGLIKSII